MALYIPWLPLNVPNPIDSAIFVILIVYNIQVVYIVAKTTACKSRYHATDISVLSLIRSLSRECIRNLISASFKRSLCAFYILCGIFEAIFSGPRIKAARKTFRTAIAVDKLFWCLHTQCTLQSFM